MKYIIKISACACVLMLMVSLASAQETHQAPTKRKAPQKAKEGIVQQDRQLHDEAETNPYVRPNRERRKVQKPYSARRWKKPGVIPPNANPAIDYEAEGEAAPTHNTDRAARIKAFKAERQAARKVVSRPKATKAKDGNIKKIKPLEE